MIQIAKPQEMSPAEVEKEILNPIVYTELKFRGWTDERIRLRFNIRRSSLREFKQERNFLERTGKRGSYKKKKS